MKIFVCLFTALLLSGAHALELSKVFEGKHVSCQGSFDIGTRAYQVSVLDSFSDDKKIELSLNIEFLKCAFQNEQFAFVPSTPDEVLIQKTVERSGKKIDVHHSIKNLNVVAFTESGSLLSQSSLSLVNEKYLAHLVLDKSKIKGRDLVFINAIGVDSAYAPETGLSSEVDFIAGSFTLR